MSDAPIPAATLILVRERAGALAPELLMVTRAEAMRFAGGAMAFPGGRIDTADRALAGADEDSAARVAAIRETLEEVAVPVALDPLPDRADALALQAALNDGRGPFGDLLDARGLRLRPDVLTPIARWVPAFHAKRRFDTLFFLAPAPPGEWEPEPQAGECAGAEWISAGEVLDRDRRGEAQLIFPTRRMLERLAQHDSFAAMRDDAARYPVDPITPHLEERDGERFVAIREGIGFPVVRERLDGLWRG